MLRSFAVALVLSCLAQCAWAQAQPAPAAPTGASATKPPARKPASRAKPIARPAGPAESGPCQIGVISAIGDLFAVQKIGLTVFGNDLAEVPIEAWGLDDLVVARVRAAAAPGAGVRKIAYPKGLFAPYDNPTTIFRNSQNELTALVRQITANSGCERYFVVTKLTVKLDSTNQDIRGVGILNRGVGPLSRTSLFAHVQLTEFDGQTFAIRRLPFAGFGSALAGAFRIGQDPLTELDNASFPEPAAEAANNAMLRDHTRALLAARLDKTLPAYLTQE
jgi:hypothetical protein